MHYKNGEDAKIGDVIKLTDATGKTTIGTVVTTIANADRCNLMVVPHLQHFPGAGTVPVPYYGTPWTLTAGECERVA